MSSYDAWLMAGFCGLPDDDEPIIADTEPCGMWQAPDPPPERCPDWDNPCDTTEEHTMTRTDASSQLIEAFPDRSICVEVEAWHYAKSPGVDARDHLRFVVSILPGLDGKACDIFVADTLEKAVGMALANREIPTDAAQVAAEADSCFAGA